MTRRESAKGRISKNVSGVKEPPCSPDLEARPNPAFEVELGSLESGGRRKMSSSTRNRGMFRSVRSRPPSIGEDDSTLSEKEKIAVRAQSLLV